MPNLTKTLTVYVGADQLPALDYTDDADWQRTELSSMASDGEAGVGTLIVRVPDGDIPNLRTDRRLAAHNVTKVVVGSNTLFRGRINARDISRGPTRGTRPQEWSVSTSDYNDDLRGIIIHDFRRPAETDAARAQAVVAAYLSGSPRASTNLNGSNFVITSSNTTTMPAKTYSAVTPMEVLQELATATGKEMFVDVDGSLHYHGPDYAGFDSIMRISDDIADLNPLTFLPIEPTAATEGYDQITRLRTYYGPGEVQHTAVVTAGVQAIDRNDYWEDAHFDDESVNATQAVNTAGKILDQRKIGPTSYTVTVGMPGVIQDQGGTPMTGDHIWKIKPGQRIAVKLRAARGGIQGNGSFSGDTFLTTHIHSITWTFPGPDQYFARLELNEPRKIGPPRRGKGQPKATTPTPAPPFEESPGDSLEHFFDANEPGGEVLAWDGLLGNQGGSGDGANGSDFYYYRSNSPDNYSHTMTWAAGDQMAVTGYWVTSAANSMMLAFTNLPPGTNGTSVVGANIISTHVLVTGPDPVAWVPFSAGPFTAPPGTTSFAIGRS